MLDSSIRVAPVRLSPTETELTRRASRWGRDHEWPLTLTVREAGGELWLIEHDDETGPVSSRSLGVGRAAARLSLPAALDALIAALDVAPETELEAAWFAAGEAEAEPVAPGLSLRETVERAVVAVASAVCVVGWFAAVFA